MPTDQGYSNQKKKGTAQFETVHNLGSERYGKAISQKGLYEITAPTAIISVTPIDGIDGQVQYYNIEYTAHGAAVNNVLRMTSGSLTNFEFDIIQVIDANNFYILAINGAPLPGDMGTVMGWVSAKFSVDGDISVMVAPSSLAFIKDGVSTNVTEDTVVPANNDALPSQMFVYIDGVQYPVSKDTGTPANTVSVPVEITGASGPINITAGDINVQLTDLGANFDRTRIGNGTFQWDMNAAGEGLVHDADVKAELVTLNTKVAAILAPTFQEILNLTTVAQTFTAPAGAKWCKVYVDDTNAANIRVKLGGVATISSGIQFQPGRSEDFGVAGNISVIAESGTNQKVNVTFGA